MMVFRLKLSDLIIAIKEIIIRVEINKSFFFVIIPLNTSYSLIFKFIEKNPLELFFAYDGSIILYWCGALEIIDINAVQRIKMIFLETLSIIALPRVAPS